MKDNAVSYQQSIQLETKLRELEAERQIVKQQRDIANKEREKVVMESVSHKVSITTLVYHRTYTYSHLSRRCCIETCLEHYREACYVQQSSIRL